MGLLTIGAFAKASRLSPKALRLYDELGLLIPARIDPANGYRLYEPGQLERARLVAWLRRAGMPLARIRTVCDLEPAAAAEELRAYWARVEAEHASRRDVVAFLVERLTGEGGSMFDVEVREVPERMLLIAKRSVTIDQLSGFTTEQVTRLGNGTLPVLPGIGGAPFLVFHGEVDADSDGPVEWCRPIPAERAGEIGRRFPDLQVRADPAHREAYVRLTAAQLDEAGSLRAIQALRDWAGEREFSGPPRQVFFADLTTAAEDAPVSDLVGPF
ncbi:helix-turn-helix domain-containing protein [Nonomuraea sp. NPDC026600]|uniref:MerR family transcriptional regulator n=1 Tax=Nonomuraea sp. NPDC026600 TaxID=3155363 RepID=UPI0033EF13B9